MASSRMPPDSSTATSSRATTSASSSRFEPAPERGVEVDEVDPLGARLLPGQRGVERVAVGGLAPGLALDEAHGLAVGDVDGGQQLEVGRHGRKPRTPSGARRHRPCDGQEQHRQPHEGDLQTPARRQRERADDHEHGAPAGRRAGPWSGDRTDRARPCAGRTQRKGDGQPGHAGDAVAAWRCGAAGRGWPAAARPGAQPGEPRAPCSRGVTPPPVTRRPGCGPSPRRCVPPRDEEPQQPEQEERHDDRRLARPGQREEADDAERHEREDDHPGDDAEVARPPTLRRGPAGQRGSSPRSPGGALRRRRTSRGGTAWPSAARSRPRPRTGRRCVAHVTSGCLAAQRVGQLPAPDTVASARSRTAPPPRPRTAREPSGTSTVFQPDVRQDRRLEPFDGARATPRTPRCDAVLDAEVEEHLHPDADAEHRPAAGEPAVDDAGATDGAEPGHAGGERADPGHDEPVGPFCRRRGRRGDRRTSAPGPRRGRARPSAGSPTRSRGPRPGAADGVTTRGVPLVDGTPTTRGSRATASRRARATALNCASTMWWALRPDEHPDVQADLRRGADRLPDVPGQRGVVAADELDDLGLDVHDVRPCRTGRRRPGTASRRAGRARRRSAGCRPCRRAPRAAPGRRPATCPRRCGARRRGGRPWCGRCRSKPAVACRAGRACGRRRAPRSRRR